MMTCIWIVSFVFVSGLVAGGVAGVLLEIWSGRRLAFCEPFVTLRHPVRSLALAALAGPFMLFNEALDAFRARRAGWTTVGSSAALSLTWTFLTGIVVVDVAFFVGGLLS
ncbi:MAG: DUF6949 family protein [Mesorhizobium sp.]